MEKIKFDKFDGYLKFVHREREKTIAKVREESQSHQFNVGYDIAKNVFDRIKFNGR